jgi:catechol 2,3-dioxygenase-like lactoylglutathione lyase family enzyme
VRPIGKHSAKARARSWFYALVGLALSFAGTERTFRARRSWVEEGQALRKEGAMLADKEATATVAVKDLAAAKKFYDGVLGLRRAAVEQQGTLIYQTGTSRLLVYPSQFAGSNQATAATWVVGDELEAIVQALAAKGVAFEHYTFPNTRLVGDIHVMGDEGKMKAAWFKDPDGNILALVSG